MDVISVAICDDEEFFREEMEKMVSVYANESEQEMEICTYATAEELIDDILSDRRDFHIMFLDVEMGDGMNGVEAAKKLRQEGHEGSICFVTGREKYALDAYRVDAIGYLTKPVKYLDVKKKIQKALIEVYYLWDVEEAQKRYLEIKTQKDIVMIDVRKILYIEKRRNLCVIHLEDSEVVCYETLKSIFARLDKGIFCYTHQGYIVNFDKIKEVKKTIVCLGEGRELPVSRKYQSELQKRHMDKIYRIRQERQRDQ